MSTKTAVKLNSDVITGDEVDFRQDDLFRITLPRDATFSKVIKVLMAKQEEMETVARFYKDYLYRPTDGAVATAAVLKRRYGIVVGKPMPGGFLQPPIPPQVIEVAVGPHGKTVQAPWGQISIPTIEGGNVALGSRGHPDYGTIFRIQVDAKRMYEKEIKAFFADVERELRTNSIYRGKAVCGADELNFIEGLDTFRAEQIVFATDVQAQLDTALFAPLRYPQAYRQEKIPLKRAVLLYGPYGTGKTSLGMMLAQAATAAVWTFVMARPGHDRVQDVLATARLYAPSVVWVEDLDTDTGSSNPKAVSEMLDAFDGVNSKQAGELIVAMSTNHIDRVPPGMLRPGRLDFVLEIAALDRPATERLIRVVVKPGSLAPDVDFDAVYAEMGGFLPAFIRATADRARSFALNRSGGNTDYVLTTQDLVNAAKSLHPQLRLHREAADPAPLPTLDRVLMDRVTSAMVGVRGFDYDNDHVLTLKAPAEPARNAVSA